MKPPKRMSRNTNKNSPRKCLIQMFPYFDRRAKRQPSGSASIVVVVVVDVVVVMEYRRTCRIQRRIRRACCALNTITDNFQRKSDSAKRGRVYCGHIDLKQLASDRDDCEDRAPPCRESFRIRKLTGGRPATVLPPSFTCTRARRISNVCCLSSDGRRTGTLRAADDDLMILMMTLFGCVAGERGGASSSISNCVLRTCRTLLLIGQITSLHSGQRGRPLRAVYSIGVCSARNSSFDRFFQIKISQLANTLHSVVGCWMNDMKWWLLCCVCVCSGCCVTCECVRFVDDMRYLTHSKQNGDGWLVERSRVCDTCQNVGCAYDAVLTHLRPLCR